MLSVVLDMESQDPDDFVTLLLLLDHPQVELKAVTITPGSPVQVGLVRKALAWFAKDIPVGAHNIDHPKPCVSSWHSEAYGDIRPSYDALPGGELLAEVCDTSTTLITGAPLKNLGAALKLPHFRLGRWVAQGGFAGEGVVPPEKQLPQFRGLRTCPTFNFNGDPKSAKKALVSEKIDEIYCVSKNVCHRVFYNEEMHTFLRPLTSRSRSLDKIWQGMEHYLQCQHHKYKDQLSKTYRINEEIDNDFIELIGNDGQKQGTVSLAEGLRQAQASKLALVELNANVSPPFCRIMPDPTRKELRKPQGKKLHDPLAACCAIDPTLAQWKRVEIFREKGKWGARLQENSHVQIIVDYDHERFLNVFIASAHIENTLPNRLPSSVSNDSISTSFSKK